MLSVWPSMYIANVYLSHTNVKDNLLNDFVIFAKIKANWHWSHSWLHWRLTVFVDARCAPTLIKKPQCQWKLSVLYSRLQSMVSITITKFFFHAALRLKRAMFGRTSNSKSFNCSHSLIHVYVEFYRSLFLFWCSSTVVHVHERV